MTIALETPKIKYISLEEYLASEEVSDYKNEYINGEVIPMTGGTTKHNQIILNLIAELISKFKTLNYLVFSENVRVWLPELQIYTYPDVMIIAGEVEYQGDRTDTITNPQVIFEILSPATQSYDRHDKFEYYRTIPTFREYFLVDQNRQHIQQFSKKSAKEWIMHEYDAEDQHITLTSKEFQIALADIYSKVKLEAE